MTAPSHLPPAAVRLLVGTVLGVLVGLAVPGTWPPVVQILAGWNTFCLVVLALVWPTLLRATPEQTRTLATHEDDTRALALLLTVAAALVSLVGVGAALALARVYPEEAVSLTLLAALTAGLAWLLLHTEYTLHYARRFYQDGGGVLFPDGENNLTNPDYRDFLYLSLTVGMTFAVSDTNLNSRPMRRLLLQHSVLSYLFGTVVVALAVSGVASLLGPG